jgi:hypothetical protein
MNTLSIKQAITSLKQNSAMLGQDTVDVSLAALQTQLNQIKTDPISSPDLRGERKAEAYELLQQRADEIGDPELRDCFIEKTATNKRLRDTWHSLQAEDNL